MKKICTEFGIAQKTYGKNMAVLIHQRIVEIKSADSIEQMVQFSIGKCHPLQGDKEGYYAMTLEQPYRLIISKDGTKLLCARIEKIEDYH